MATTTRAILKLISNDKVKLQKGPGYWYFVYDAPEANIFYTYSVMSMYLGSLSNERWADIGKRFAADVEAGTFGISSHY